MFNALPQGYSRPKVLTISGIISIAIVLVLTSLDGKISFKSKSLAQPQPQSATVSIQKFKIQKPAETPTPVEKPAEKPEEVEPQKIEIPSKPIVEKQTNKPTEKPIEKQPVKKPAEAMPQKVQKPVEKPSETPQTEAQKTSQNVENPQQTAQKPTEITEDNTPVTQPSHIGLNNNTPQYPIISFQLGENGNVTIEYIVSADGTILEAKVVESSGFERLDRVSLSQFKQWKFKPARNILGNPVQSGVRTIVFSFNIETQTITMH